MTELGLIYSYLSGRMPELLLRTGEHLMLTGLSTFFAILIGVPLGTYIFRYGFLRTPVMGIIGILQTIPSLAMLVFLLAILNKIGAAPALIALTVYALLPIVRNTLTGLDGVPPNLIEAAKGIGMTAYQELKLVRFPLAVPVIVAGIRTSAVVGVGIATLSAFIGAGGLGQFINRGLALSDTKLILLGAVPAAILALIVDFSIGGLEWALKPERKRDKKWSFKAIIRPVVFAIPFVIVLAGVLPTFISSFSAIYNESSHPGADKIIRIGTKNYTEQIILGEIMTQLIEAKTDITVDRRFNLGGSMICHGALVNGGIDLYAEYTGTALTAVLNAPVISNPDDALKFVSEKYMKQFDLIWLKPFGFNNTYAITVRSDDAKKNGWQKISDLAGVAHNLDAGFTSEFAERPDGYPGIKKTYNLSFKIIRDLDPSLMYEAIHNKKVDVICAFTTDGRIEAYKLKPLQDDKIFFPPYNAVPVVRMETLKKYPELKETLLLLYNKIDDTTMQRLNYAADGKGQSPSKVANDFLKSAGLLNN
ncbi:MAG: ABC transporter permease subunit [Proteobacteria bacterium]|nr:ABC transporter permease subunit [Pseudomonadota bacterium]